MFFSKFFFKPLLFFTGSCSEIIETKRSIDNHEARGDDLKFSVSFPPGKKLLLRFWLGHSARAFEHYARLAKDAFRAFGFAEEQIIAISLTASHSPSLKLFITKDGMKHKIHVDVNLLEGTNSSVEPSDLKRELDQTGKDATHVCLSFSYSVGKIQICFPSDRKDLSLFKLYKAFDCTFLHMYSRGKQILQRLKWKSSIFCMSPVTRIISHGNLYFISYPRNKQLSCSHPSLNISQYRE